MSALEHEYPGIEWGSYPALAGPGAGEPLTVEMLAFLRDPRAFREPEVLEPGSHVAEMADAAAAHDWPRYFRSLGLKTVEDRGVTVPQPEPELTSLMPVPDGFKLPGGASTLFKRIQAAGWEARSGYSRASRKGVRLNEWVLCHYAGIWGQRGSQRVYGRWWARVQPEGVLLKWSWDKGSVNGWHMDKVGTLVAALAAEPGEPISLMPEKVTDPRCRGRGRLVSPAHPLESIECPDCEGAGVIKK